MMKIAYFTESLPPLTDGVSRTLTQLKETLDSEHIDYRFYSPFCPADADWACRVYKLLSIPFPLYPDYRISLPSFHDLRDSLERFQPDLVHICSPFLSGLAAYEFAARHEIPVVNSFHTRFISYLKYYGYGWLEQYGWRYLRWYYNRGDMCFVPSLTTIRELDGKGFENLTLWARGIDTSQFSPAYCDISQKRRWSPDGKPTAVFVGRLVAEKDIDILLESHSILKQRNIDYTLVMVGEGPLREKINRTMPDIILTGHLEGDRLSRAYASADFFVFPSTTESFGNVIQEAGASGLPAVAAAEGGVRDLILDGETGFLAKPKDALDFANKMEELIKDDSLRNYLAAKAYDTATQKSWNIINRGLIENYRKVIEKRKCGSADIESDVDVFTVNRHS
jgi:glycosyltransferase involved in cell wall biosynthesis